MHSALGHSTSCLPSSRQAETQLAMHPQQTGWVAFVSPRGLLSTSAVPFQWRGFGVHAIGMARQRSKQTSHAWMRDGWATQILHMVPLPGHIVVPVGTSRQMVSEQWEHDSLRQEDDGSTSEDGMTGTMRGSMAPIICVRPERWESDGKRA